MKYSNEFLARVYGAYSTSDILLEQRFHDKDKILWKAGESVKIHRSGGIYSAIELGKLLLTPLSAITDEDAIEVAKIVRPYLSDHPNFKLFGKVISLHIANNTYDTLLGYRRVKEAIDHIRSKGYDCGFAEIPSLIDAGIAIDKTMI